LFFRVRGLHLCIALWRARIVYPRLLIAALNPLWLAAVTTSIISVATPFLTRTNGSLPRSWPGADPGPGVLRCGPMSAAGKAG
jgi:hypothetical protein